MLSQLAFASAAAEVRAAQGSLSAIIAELYDTNVWSGEDAARFQAEWNSLVVARLSSAAGRLDTCDFTPFT